MGCPIFRRTYSEAVEDSPSKKKIVLLGLDGAGKSSVLEFLKTGQHSNQQSTVGVNIETIVNEASEYLIFDIGGKVRSLWAHYYDNVDAFIFVIDVTDKTRFGLVREELKKLNENEKIKDKIMLIYLNKQDKNDGLLQDQDLLQLNGVNDVTEIDVIVQKASALRAEGVKEGFLKLIKVMTAFEKSKVSRKQDDSEQLVKSKIITLDSSVLSHK